MLYFDTSALLPYYRHEARSDAVEQLLLSGEPVLISDLTRVEFASALARWVRTQEIEEPHAQRISRRFDEDIRESRFIRCRNTPSQMDLAAQWLLTRTTSLRTLDALHLACAATENATLVTLDEVLHTAAGTFGVSVREVRND